jgi:hypothetical protein
MRDASHGLGYTAPRIEIRFTRHAKQAALHSGAIGAAMAMRIDHTLASTKRSAQDHPFEHSAIARWRSIWEEKRE